MTPPRSEAGSLYHWEAIGLSNSFQMGYSICKNYWINMRYHRLTGTVMESCHLFSRHEGFLVPCHALGSHHYLSWRLAIRSCRWACFLEFADLSSSNLVQSNFTQLLCAGFQHNCDHGCQEWCFCMGEGQIFDYRWRCWQSYNCSLCCYQPTGLTRNRSQRHLLAVWLPCFTKGHFSS